VEIQLLTSLYELVVHLARPVLSCGSMRVGIPIWNDRVSPVLDTAERLLVVDSACSGSASRREVLLDPASPSHQATRIGHLELDLLVCGAISRVLSDMLAATGLTLKPWIAGDVEEVLRAVGTDQLGAHRFAMPGCCQRRCRGRQHGRSQGGSGRQTRRAE
jgi:predicted Fe-Mo cluster-binding NifX family protein